MKASSFQGHPEQTLPDPHLPMSISRLQYLVVDALEDVKAQDIRVFDTSRLSDLFDRVIVATATSNRQTRALAANIQERARDEGFPVVSVEGEGTGEWVLVDLGDLIVHIMQPGIRAYYNLEELWGATPVPLPLTPEGPAGSQVPADRSLGLKPARPQD